MISGASRPARAATFTVASIMSLAFSVPPAFAAPSIFGRWLTDDRSAVVRIDRCGRTLCGAIERVLDPRAPAKDINNPAAARRTQPLIGTTVLSGFTPSGSGWSGGRAYDPKSGRSYRSRLRVKPDGALEVTGCILMLCRSRNWTRAN